MLVATVAALATLGAAAPAPAATPGTGPALEVAIDPLQPQRVWALGLDGLHRSDDGGATFRRIVGGEGVTHLMAVAGAVLVVDDFGDVRRSADGGRTWSPVPIDAGAPIERSAGDPRTVVAFSGDLPNDELGTRPKRKPRATGGANDPCFGLFPVPLGQSPMVVSHDAGATWSPVPPPPGDGLIDDIAVAGAGLVVSSSSFDFPPAPRKVLRTSDFGAHWTDITAAFPDVLLGDITADAAQPNRLWMHRFPLFGSADVTHLLRSDDLGGSWADLGPASGFALVPTTSGLHDLRGAFIPCQRFGPSTGGPGLFTSGDGGLTFQADVTGLPANAGVAAYDQAGAVEVVATGYGVFRRSGGGSWTASGTALTPGVVTDLVRAGRLLYAGTPDGAFVSRDRGRSWAPVPGLPAHAAIAGIAAARGQIAIATALPTWAVYAGLAGHRLAPLRAFPADGAVRGLAYDPAGELLVATGNRLLRRRGLRLARVHLFGRGVQSFSIGASGVLCVLVNGRLGRQAVLISRDGGRTFQGQALARGAFASHVYNAGRGFYLDGSFPDGGSDGVRDVRPLEAPGDVAGGGTRFVPLRGWPRIAWLAGAGGLFRTHDGGVHWRNIVPSTARLGGGSAVLIDGRRAGLRDAREGRPAPAARDRRADAAAARRRTTTAGASGSRAASATATCRRRRSRRSASRSDRAAASRWASRRRSGATVGSGSTSSSRAGAGSATP